MSTASGVDLKKILGATKILGEKVAITDETIGISQLLGAQAPAVPPKVTYVYSSWVAYNCKPSHIPTKKQKERSSLS